MSEREEKRFIARLRRYDERAHSELAARFGSDVQRRAYHMLRDHHEAEDIAQEVFVTAFKKIAQFREEGSLKGWLLTITSNMARDRIKYLKLRGRGYTEQIDGEEGRSVAGTSDVHAQAVSREKVQRLVRALAHLPPEFREVLVLQFSEGLSYDEIAARVRVPVGTVRSRIARARIKIHELMKEEVGGDERT